jgi:hypothetical protein
LNLEREITTALKITLQASVVVNVSAVINHWSLKRQQALKTENEVIYESLCVKRIVCLSALMRETCRYDTEAECEALEQEKHAMELKLVTKERKYVSIIF